MARPILDLITNAIKKYFETHTLAETIALILSLFAKPTNQPVFAAAGDPDVVEIREKFDQLTDEEKSQLSCGMFSPAE